MTDPTVNRFRQKRGARLREQIARQASELGRPLTILDVGGRPDYWRNVSPHGVAVIKVLNLEPKDLTREGASGLRFEGIVGDACDLSEHQDGAIDFVHSNSVIEHVGSFARMRAMAREMRRVGKAGWVQAPAFEFPVEPHWKLPFVHWFGAPVKAAALRARYRHSAEKSRERAEGVNLPSKGDFKLLFPDAELFVERLALLPKSYVATW